MTYKLIEYMKITQNTKILKIDDFAMSHSQMLGKFEYTLPAKF